jgi:glycosyltransferase 2 family protein
VSDGKGSRGRKVLVTALKLAVAAALITFIVRRIWRDELRYEAGDDLRQFHGAIVGDWTSDRIRFTFDPPVTGRELPAEWGSFAQEATLVEIDVARDARTRWNPGMPTVFSRVEPRGFAVALAMLLFGILATAARWWRLLKAAGCVTSYWNALRLSFVGFFFNIVVPGLTGGDVVKAVMVARDHPERRAAAAISVLVDRLIGLFVLALMGAVTILAQGETFAAYRWPVIGIVVAAVAGVTVYSNAWLRARLGYERLLARLPMAGTLRQIDEAVTIYSRKPYEFLLALAFSFANQCSVIVSLIALGRSFGDTALTAAQYVVVGSIGNIASAVPLTPGGVGIAEYFYAELFKTLGGVAAIGLAVSISWRLCMVLMGLAGGLFLLAPGARMSQQERAQLAR